MARLGVLIALWATSVLVAACSNDEEATSTTATAAPSAAPSAQTASTASPLSATPTLSPAAGSERYTSPAHGYTIDYPVGWSVYPPPFPAPSDLSPTEDVVSIYSTQLCKDCAGEGPIPPGQIKVDIYWISNPAGQLLEDIIRQRNFGATITSEVQTSVSGHAGVYQTYTSEFGSNVEQVFLQADNAVYQIAIAYGDGADTAAGNGFLNSFRLPS